MVEDLIQIIKEENEANSSKTKGDEMTNPNQMMKGASKYMPKMPKFSGSNFKMPSIGKM